MNKFFPLYTYGAIIIFAGVYLMLSSYLVFDNLKFTLGISLSVGAVFAFITALARQKAKIQLAYHEMHALAMMVYGVAVMLFCNTLETLLYFTALLFFFYAFSEIIFCNWLFNLKQKVAYKILLVRLFFGIVTAIGTVVIINNANEMKISAMKSYGILFVLVGANVLLYVPVMKSREAEDAPEGTQQLPGNKYHHHPSVKY